MRTFFETNDNKCDFEIFRNEQNTITFNSENSNEYEYNNFFFTMEVADAILLRDKLTEIINSINK